MTNSFLGRIFFHIAQSGKIIEDFALGPRTGRGEFAPFFQGAHLFEGQRVSLNGRRGMSVTRTGILLQSRHPGKIDHRALNALAQRRHLLNFSKQGWSDGELRNIGHGKRLSECQV